MKANVRWMVALAVISGAYLGSTTVKADEATEAAAEAPAAVAPAEAPPSDA